MALTEERPLVSLLVAAWNEAPGIEDCIRSILALGYISKELILCVGGEDETWKLAKQFANQRVTVLRQHPGDGKQKALQRCFDQANGQIIFLTDADCLVDDTVFENTLRPLIEENEAVVTGSWKPFQEQLVKPLVLFQWSQHLLRGVSLPDYVDTLDGRNAAISRSAIEKVNALQAAAPIGTDYVISKALTAGGFSIRLVRESRVQTRYPERVSDYFKQQSRWFRNRLVHGARMGDWSEVLSQVRASSAAVFMLVAPVLGFWTKWSWWLWTGALGYLIWCQIRVIYRINKFEEVQFYSLGYLVRLPIYVAISWVALVLGMLDALSPKRRWRW